LAGDRQLADAEQQLSAAAAASQLKLLWLEMDDDELSMPPSSCRAAATC